MNNSIRMIGLSVWFVNASVFATSTCTKLNTTDQSYLSAEAQSAGYYVSNNFIGAADGYFNDVGLPKVISINSGTTFQPKGSVLATSTASFLNSANLTPYGAKQVLFRCDLSDRNDLWEYYSVNADLNQFGRNAVPDIPGAYYSDYNYVAYRITNLSTGDYYSRYQKARKLDPNDMFQDSKYIYVPAGVFSDISIEVIKLDGNEPNNFGYNYGRYTLTAGIPRAYIGFKGGGVSNGLSVGCDHATGCWDGWYIYWPGAWGIGNNVTLIRGAFCQVSDYTPVVTIPKTTAASLNGGIPSQANFTIGLSCELGAESGTTSNTSSSLTATRPIAIGLLANSANAVSQAELLGLKTTGGGLTYLLSNDYGNAGVAEGVGIKIYDDSGTAMNFLPSPTTGAGNSGGWYGFKEVTQLESTGTSLETYRGHFTASLEKISGETATPGTVYAQAQIIVTFQ